MKYIGIAFLLGILLAGCASRSPEPTLMTVPEPQPTAIEQTIPETHPDTAEYYINYVYPEQLREYYEGLVGRWNAEAFSLLGRSPLAARYLQGDPLENVGFLLEDLDGDGLRELLIGAIRGAAEDPLIFELWTLDAEEPRLVLCAGEEDRYFLLEGSPGHFAREIGEQKLLRRRAFRDGRFEAADPEAARGTYRAPRYYPFFLYEP